MSTANFLKYNTFVVSFLSAWIQPDMSCSVNWLRWHFKEVKARLILSTVFNLSGQQIGVCPTKAPIFRNLFGLFSGPCEMVEVNIIDQIFTQQNLCSQQPHHPMVRMARISIWAESQNDFRAKLWNFSGNTFFQLGHFPIKIMVTLQTEAVLGF